MIFDGAREEIILKLPEEEPEINSSLSEIQGKRQRRFSRAKAFVVPLPRGMRISITRP